MHLRTPQVLCGHLLPQSGLDEGRACQEQGARALNHGRFVAHRGGVGAWKGGGAGN